MHGCTKPAASRIALATYSLAPELVEDDRLLLEPLARRGIDAEPVVWDTPDVDWAAYDAVIIRSCWDYYLRREEFLDWVARLEATGTPLWNPPDVVRWNSDKSYLQELEADGVPIVPTRWVTPEETATLEELLEETGWDEVVVKPVVSAGAHETWRTSRARAADDEPRFRAQASRQRLMIQPFLPEITTAGEYSLFFFGGEFSHAVVKRPCPGDFRVQLQYGGQAIAVEPDDALLSAARAALRGIPGDWLYARVDGCYVNGTFRIMELEALEPALFLAWAPGAPERFAQAVEAVLAVRRV
jgi:glutathione synthase/RimK-type ligase-like ATP-grasp enzyme